MARPWWEIVIPVLGTLIGVGLGALLQLRGATRTRAHDRALKLIDVKIQLYADFVDQADRYISAHNKSIRMKPEAERYAGKPDPTDRAERDRVIEFMTEFREVVRSSKEIMDSLLATSRKIRIAAASDVRDAADQMIQNFHKASDIELKATVSKGAFVDAARRDIAADPA